MGSGGVEMMNKKIKGDSGENRENDGTGEHGVGVVGEEGEKSDGQGIEGIVGGVVLVGEIEFELVKDVRVIQRLGNGDVVRSVEVSYHGGHSARGERD
jgi:hypothetical protein